MRHDPNASFLAHWRRSRPTAELEPADMGTAFGLEMSLQPVSHEPAAPGHARTAADQGWLQRMRRRRS
jgi:hypothetical protein